jgi:hypothetical protein
MLRRYAQLLIVLIVLAGALFLAQVASPAGGNVWHAAVAAADGWSWDD